MMDTINNTLEPLTKLFPQEVQDFLTGGGWLLILGVLALLLFLGVWSLFRRRRPEPRVDWNSELMIDLEQCPLPGRPGERQLVVYHLPARLRLVVLAPAGKDHKIDATAVEKYLDRIVPGLGAAAATDRPRIRVWPPQLSHQGFANTFHRCTHKAEPEEAPSRWVLLAGRAQLGKVPVLLGLGAWADEPNVLGRKILEPHEWPAALRLERTES
jgi:hypothetical protein